MTLTEMLFLIGILAIAVLIEAQLFRWSLTATQSAPQSVQQHALLDRAIAAMRADVWNSSSIQTPDVRTFQLQSGDGSQIVWSLNETGARRQHGQAVDAFDFAPQLTVHAAPGGVALRDARNPADAVNLTSQLIVLGARP
jgi:hypothetical protein